MPIVGVKCIRGKMSMEECQSCRSQPLHPCGYPTELITFMLKKEDDEPDGLTHSPSRILGCHRRAILEAREDCYFDVDYAYASLRGTLIHTGLEHLAHTDSTVAEKRVTTMVDTAFGPQPFQAKSDAIVVLSEEWVDWPNEDALDEAIKRWKYERVNVEEELIREWKTNKQVAEGLDAWESQYPLPKKMKRIHVKVRDWKTTGEIGHDFLKADIKHQMQVNCYAYVVVKEAAKLFGPGVEVIVSELEINYLGFTKPRRFTSAGSLPAVGKKPRGSDEAEMLTLEPIKILPTEKVEAFIRKSIERRMRERQAATLPPPLEGDAAKWCFRCPVFAACKREG